jgi:hypothetical protein
MEFSSNEDDIDEEALEITFLEDDDALETHQMKSTIVQ